MRLDELLSEIIDANSLPYEWKNENFALIESIPRLGIFVEYLTLNLVNKNISVANISFGKVSKDIVSSSAELDTNLTGAGQPRTIFTTVANAISTNNEIVNSDLICLAASDKSKHKRSILYSIALAEFQSKHSEFKTRNSIHVKTSNGTLISILSKLVFSDEEKNKIEQELSISKVL